jgi:DNA-binding CsgD family transcriptional regulator
MRQLDHQQLKDAFKIIRTASAAPNVNALALRTLDAICGSLHIDKGVFILTGGDSKSIEFKGRNIKEKYHEQFRSYYHKYDPFNICKSGTCKKKVVSMDEIVDYQALLSSEYYNDFLLPQEIYHKAVVYLKPKKDCFSNMIALFKPRESPGFLREDIALLRFVAPYIAYSLERVQFFPRLSIQEHVLKAVESHLSEGLIVVDDAWNVLHATEKADRFYKVLTGASLSKNQTIPFSPMIIKDCIFLASELDDRKGMTDETNLPLLPRTRVLKSNRSEAYSLRTSYVQGSEDSIGRRLFTISIKELNETNSSIFNERLERLMPAYYLTERELEIASNICEGLRNLDIADRLFISEITVKKHVQNIFDKMGVGSRSALIYKIMTT